ncbi:hypothetical protein [Propionivibrio sp.]|uniref:hypothetical protein n=1 Tax=Propionivibrio sp. TaxID=2212460 RepID=UPI0034566F5A
MTKHLPSVLTGFQAGKHNGRVEAMNRALQEARARARGAASKTSSPWLTSSPENSLICPPRRSLFACPFHTTRPKAPINRTVFWVASY